MGQQRLTLLVLVAQPHPHPPTLLSLCADVDGMFPPLPALSQYALADVQCARSSDFGKNDEIHCTRTHLGNVLKAGDIAWGCVAHIDTRS